MLEQNVVEFSRRTIAKEVDQYLSQRKHRNENTYRSYQSDIEHFFQTVFRKHYKLISLEEFDSDKTELDNLMLYFDNLYDMKKDDGDRLFTNGTINRKQASIKSLFRFLKVKKVYNHDLTELQSITNLPVDTKSIEKISFETAMNYAEWFKVNEKNKSNEKHLITLLAIDIGKRATELLSLKWNQFMVESDYVLMHGIGKNNKKWNEKISLDFYEEIIKLKSDSEKVFTLTYSDLVRMVNNAKEAFGDTDRKISFHSFRKCSLTNTYRLTGDILEAQRKGGHASLDTTQLYVETENYGITGLISLGDNIPTDLYKTVDKRTLVKAIELMNKDFKFILNHKINETQKQKNNL